MLHECHGVILEHLEGHLAQLNRRDEAIDNRAASHQRLINSIIQSLDHLKLRLYYNLVVVRYKHTTQTGHTTDTNTFAVLAREHHQQLLWLHNTEHRSKLKVILQIHWLAIQLKQRKERYKSLQPSVLDRLISFVKCFL